MPETDLTIAATVAERLRLAVAREPFTVRAGGQKLPVTISVGVTAATEKGDNRDCVLKRADDALYSAKTSGRNRVIVRSPGPPPLAEVASLTGKTNVMARS